VARTVDVGVDEARRDWDALARFDIDVDDVARVLEEEGLSSFSKSFDELLTALQAKADEIAARG
jgi:transaldolase